MWTTYKQQTTQIRRLLYYLSTGSDQGEQLVSTTLRLLVISTTQCLICFSVRKKWWNFVYGLVNVFPGKQTVKREVKWRISQTERRREAETATDREVECSRKPFNTHHTGNPRRGGQLEPRDKNKNKVRNAEFNRTRNGAGKRFLQNIHLLGLLSFSSVTNTHSMRLRCYWNCWLLDRCRLESNAHSLVLVVSNTRYTY